uniref:SUMO-activating enzyme subunit n=1 Tax=Lygus hesperus TaxID=30085 RepID=A0A0A9XDS9_LYGHE
MALTSISEELRSKVASSKILVVGAGGIGCELLKNLVLTGFGDIEVIDLDTIDVSNLNRQFLFQRKHVGRPKAEVAKESCLKFNPNARITAHCANVMSKEYSMSYFEKFNVVLNALDNRAARAHVNRMCLSANVPLIESGTSGYAGQVELIYKKLTPCYECVGPQEQKTYPACTIRTTPTEHIHCTIWAKYLFNQLFGENPDNTDEEVFDIRTDATKDTGDAPGDKEEIPKTSPREWAQQTGYDAEKLFNKLFNDDILYNLSMSDLWQKRKPPVPLPWDKAVDDSPAGDSSGGMNDQKIWSIAECKQQFADALKALKEASEELGEGENLVWDKDDEPAMNLVAAAANIRAHVYGIPMKSKFEIKAMAGNIIPAIATSNAVVAGLIVLFALKVLDSKMEECKTVYLRNCVGSRRAFIAPETGFPPRNPKCFVCSSQQISLVTDMKKLTLKDLEKLVLRGKLSMIEPEVMMDEKVLISSEEGETDHLADKTLSEVGVLSGGQLKVEDFVQNYEIKMIVVDKQLKEDEGRFIITGDLDTMKSSTKEIEAEKPTPETNGASSGPSTSQPESDDDDVIMCIEDEPSTSGLSKRKPIEESSIPVKKRRTEGDDCIIIN